MRGTEAEDPEKMCSILLLDEEGEHLLNYLAPSLPDFYNEAIHGDFFRRRNAMVKTRK